MVNAILIRADLWGRVAFPITRLVWTLAGVARSRAGRTHFPDLNISGPVSHLDFFHLNIDRRSLRDRIQHGRERG